MPRTHGQGAHISEKRCNALLHTLRCDKKEMSSAYLGPLRIHGAQKPWENRGNSQQAMFDYRVSTGYVSGKELIGEATSKNIGFWEYTWHVTIQKHRILRIHMTCYYGHLWAIVFTLVVMCVCISICTHTHEINAYTEQSSCQKDIRIYSGDFGPRHSLLLSL